MPDADEAFGVGIGQRFEQDAFEDTEDDGVGANTGSEGDDGDDGEQRSAHQPADGLPELTAGTVHGPPGVAADAVMGEPAFAAGGRYECSMTDVS